MRTSDYKIQVTADSVDVECDVPLRSSRFPKPQPSPRSIGSAFVLFALVMLYHFCFGHGRDPSIWRIVVDSRSGSVDFVSNLIPVFLPLALGVFLLAVGIRHFLPFCERLHCDRSTLTWSKIPWLSFGYRRVTRSIPVAEIVRASYAIVYKSEGYYGIVLDTYDKSWKTFWGIESPEANRILRGLKQLGINVYHDPEMREDIRETLRDRRAEL
jgi:hypothetical protein